ncbi:MAG: HEAT repeat domain-containing protein [Candidatus Cloacimonetes bacterium]|nr:HEAT repeat domain-containing protein [Candidatus Cloacimonadota bacterium]
MLKDEDYKVRIVAVWALGNSGDKLAIEPLNKLLINEKGRIKMEVWAALKKIKKKSSLK